MKTCEIVLLYFVETETLKERHNVWKSLINLQGPEHTESMQHM
jgi:hypothetical protein